MDIKRKYADKLGWKRILEKRCKYTYVKDAQFEGYLSILYVDKVTGVSIKNVCEESVCIVDDGYIWLQQFFINRNYSITTIYDKNKKLTQWYIDIIKGVGLDERNIPYFDDLFLDIIMTPTSGIEVLDRDELDDALKECVVTEEEYNKVLNIADYVIANELDDRQRLINNSNKYLEYMLKM